MIAKNKAPMPETLAAWRFLPEKADDWVHGGWSDDHDHKTTSYTRTDYAQALVAAAYEAAACRFDEIAQHDQEGIDYSSMVGVPISNLSELERSVKAAESDAEAIRALTPTDAKSALDRLIAEAVKEALEKAEQIARDHIPINGRPLQTRVTATAIADEIAALKGGEA